MLLATRVEQPQFAEGSPEGPGEAISPDGVASGNPAVAGLIDPPKEKT
jgi:hypothetical protein